MWYWFAVWCCRVFCCVFFNLRIQGRENIPEEGAFVLISNHQSFLDPLFCGMYLRRPLYFIGRDTLFANRLFGWLISSVNTIPVRRGKADLTAMKKVISKLRDGRAVCLFPEATRSRDGRIEAFKAGFGLLCRRGNAAIVPVVIEGAFECWPRHQKIFTPGSRIVVSYGKTITAREVKDMSNRVLAKTLTDRLRQMQNDCRLRQGREPYCY